MMCISMLGSGKPESQALRPVPLVGLIGLHPPDVSLRAFDTLYRRPFLFRIHGEGLSGGFAKEKYRGRDQHQSWQHEEPRRGKRSFQNKGSEYCRL